MSKLLLEKLELKQLKQSWKLDQDQLCILAEKQEYLSKYESDLCEIFFPQTHPSVVTLNANKRVYGLWRSCNPLCYTAIVLYKLKTFPSISGLARLWQLRDLMNQALIYDHYPAHQLVER